MKLPLSLIDSLRVAAAIIRENGKVLIAQRKKDSPSGLKWEFPGGKLEDDESPKDGLRRELREELGIEAENLDFFTRTRHTYEEFDVELLFYNVCKVSGDLHLNSHERLVWADIDELSDYDFVDADIPIIKKIMMSKDVF